MIINFQLGNMYFQVLNIKVTAFVIVILLLGNIGLASAQLDSTGRAIKAIDIVPSVTFVLAGLITQGEISRKLNESVVHHYPTFHTNAEDYLVWAPGVVSLGLAASGVKGRHKLGDQLILAVLSNVLSQGVAQSMKRIIKYERPNGVDKHSFPSGHSTTAFTNATILQEEYGYRSPLYTIGGYGMATSVGALRILNNEHWLADVLVGAGIGIVATKLVYLTYPWVQKKYRKVVHKKKQDSIPY